MQAPQTKGLLSGRESLTLQSQLGQRITKETMQYYGGSDKIKITPSLLAAQIKASQSYRKRVESEQAEKKKHDAMIRQEAEQSRKRAAEADKKAKVEEKRRKLEDEEKRLTDELKYDDVMLDGMSERASHAVRRAKNGSDLAEVKSALENADQMRKKMNGKREQLSQVSSQIKKLLLKSQK